MKKVFLAVVAVVMVAVGQVGAQGLILSELLYQPHSGEAEYLELYNAGDTDVDLADYHIVRWVDDAPGKHYPLPSHTVARHDYVVLTKDAASVSANYTVKYISKVVECSLPTYPNDGGSVVLALKDSSMVEKLDYSPAMHSRLLRDKAGVALERRSFERPCNEASNWFSASSVAGYGTPGYENSQSDERLVEEAAFTFSSQLISPDGDNYQDELTVDYRMDDGSLSARAEVYDGRGMLVRRLLDGDLLGTAGSFVWDGRNAAGATVARGQYVIQITVYNHDGVRQTIRRTVAVVER